MNDLDKLVDAALQDPMAAARAHHAAGGRVIGYVGAEIPVELIDASHAFPLRLPSLAQTATAAADRYLEPTFAPDIRSIAEAYLQGALDFLDALILPRSNDSAQRLYYYLDELRRRQLTAGPVPRIYDLAKIPRATSRAHTRAATRRLAQDVGVDPQALPAAIARRNRRRELFAGVARLRTRNAGMCGSAADRILKAADLCAADPFDAALGAWLAAQGTDSIAPGTDGTAPESGRRLLLLGSAPPDERLHVAVESAGGCIVAEIGEHPSCGVALPLIPASGTLDAVADHYHEFRFSPRAFVDRIGLTLSEAQRIAADGVIIWLIEQEEALIWDLPAQLARLAAAQVPTLSLVRRRWDGADGALEEIAAFVKELRVHA